ncbi:MAG: FAD-dependent oxidoreductase [Burkholderiaceae bacterium]
MSESKTICVIGAGIVGVSAAIWLLREGFQVVLVDKTGPAAGTSHGNAGVLAACSVVPVTVPGLIRKAPAMLFGRYEPLFLRWRHLPAMAPWLFEYLSHCKPDEVRRIARALAPLTTDTLAQHRALAETTGAEKLVAAGDYVFGYQSKAHFAADQFGWQVRRENGFEWTEHDQQSFAATEPVFGNRVGYGVRVGNHGRILDPGLYVRDLADHARAQGARIEVGSVDALVIDDARVTGVRINGQTLAADGLVVATGVWSGPLASQLGIRVPMESERGYHLEFWEADRMPADPVMLAAYKVVATPMAGRLRLAGAVEFGGLNAPASDPPFEMLTHAIQELLPGIRYTRTEQWMGHRPAPSDSIPLIGQAPAVAGAWLAFGHHHIGLTTGPKTGRLIAQMIAGKSTDIDMTAFDPGRFSRPGSDHQRRQVSRA